MVRLTRIRHQTVKVRSRLHARAESSTASRYSFQCNICGSHVSAARGALSDREAISCKVCKSTLRFRSLVAALLERLGCDEDVLASTTIRKGVRGLGLSDSPVYAEWLKEKYAYQNTFLHKAPALDILCPSIASFGSHDFVISSDVFEHVNAPVQTAFINARRLLKPQGILLLTVPYKLDGATEEHYPEIFDYRVVIERGNRRVVNLTRDGRTQVFDNPVFHGGDGSTLEMRLFSLPSILQHLGEAGFSDIRVHNESIPKWGIFQDGLPSVPISALA